ncbi:SPOR domain-containing protein [Desulfospira joergensenii]|uniref:SPOR domain-containing protein n=1 Tax=Desulfospira joergensenii TaxID=53329 RepID=UPI0003B65C75|nr:SPOR domain-containing protein [Desulfospira joergensenii]
MIRYLRNISVCLWVSSLFSIPFSFLALPWIRQVLTGVTPGAGLIGVAIFFYGLTTTGFHFLGRKMILNFIREGTIWEQAGIIEKARKRYGAAVRVYDSFLLFPLSGEATGKKLIHALAKFSLGPGAGNFAHGRRASCLYLRANPEDSVLAELWLRRFLDNLGDRGEPEDSELELLTSLAELHRADETFLSLLAGAFLALGRTDTSARLLYSRVLGRPRLRKTFEDKIDLLLGPSPQGTPDGERGLGDFIPITADQAYDEIPIRSGPAKKEPGILFIRKALIRSWNLFTRAGARGVKFLKASGRVLVSILRSFTAFALAAVDQTRQREKSGPYIRAGILGGMAVFLLIFVINTISHMQHPSGMEKGAQVIEAQIPKPFTIQVAAYLKPSHADRYLTVLNKKDLDAFVEKVKGGGKTWYVIRISRFPDKKSAEAYGNQLKKQKIIEDFFVCNR